MNIEEESIKKDFQIVLATKNLHKIREIKTILSELLPNLDVLSLLDFPDYTPVKETGKTFEENAILKAIDAAKVLNKWTLADDSGLVVPSLNGEPGVYSARYAGENATDKDNRAKLLSKLESLSEKERYAYFQCCMAIASPNGLKKCACSKVEGKLTLEERGGEGFGYDPIFIKHDYNQTFAELKEAIKNKISHRRKAIDKILATLENLNS
ncbi:MAG: XTP/dITP diphosphatase [Parachlamydiales bacterium]|nr:XTP/dITP diphosphatase [Parachlamydiales bacterium]